MPEDWEDPQPLDLGSLSIQDAPAPDHVMPNHHASSEAPWAVSDVEAPKRKTVRERLMGAAKREEPQNVRAPKERKHVPNKPGQFVEPVENFYNTVAMVLMPFKPEVAFTIMSPGPATEDGAAEPPTVAHNCAVAWDNAAQRSEAVRNFLDSFMTIGVMGQLLAAHAPIVIAALPASKFNPAAAMEEMLRRRAEQQEQGTNGN